MEHRVNVIEIDLALNGESLLTELHFHDHFSNLVSRAVLVPRYLSVGCGMVC